MTHTRTAKSRVLAGLATFATVAAVSIPLLATPASAAVSSVTVAPATYQAPAGTFADVTANVTPAADPTPIRYVIVSGPDADQAGNGTLADGVCTGVANPRTCHIVNTGGPGVDTVTVFADNNGTLNPAGQPSSTATIQFFGPATGVDLKPDSDTAAAGTCNPFTVTVTDAATPAGGVPSQQVRLEATLTGDATGRSLSFCEDPADPNDTNAGGDTTLPANNPPGTTAQALGTVTTDSTGKATFGIRSNQPGGATVRAYVDKNANSTFDAATEPSDISTKTFTAGGGDAPNNAAQDAVAPNGLTVSPPSQTAAVNDNVVYTVTARNASGDTTPNVIINYKITGANPNAGATLSPTNNSGVATLSYTATNPGTDTITFWVNQTTAAPATPDANAGEPTATATTTIPGPPSGNTIDLTCTGTSANTTAEDCVQPLTHKSETFTALVTKGGVAQAGIPVRFSFSSTAPGTAPVVFNTVTGADGKAVFTPTDANAVHGTVNTVTATIAGQTTPAPGGVNTDTGTVTFQQATPHDRDGHARERHYADQRAGSTFTATVIDQFGAPVPGVNVDFSITGRNAALIGGPALMDKITDANGQASITYTDTGAANAAGYRHGQRVGRHRHGERHR